MNYLDEIAKEFSIFDGMYHWTNIFQYKIFKEYFIGETALELGCADGDNTNLLTKDFKHVTAIDGSKKAIECLKKHAKGKNLTAIQGFFEDVNLTDKFDTIIMGHIMEHVKDPVQIMSKYKSNLKPKGRIIISVPNADSFHRIAAVKMGLLKKVNELNDNDIKIGHRRVYDFKTLERDIKKSGLKIIKREGYWIKLLPNPQIEKQWSEEQIKVYMGMGREYPEHAAEIIVICEKE